MNAELGCPTPLVLCDADGCLFPSEVPAYEASAAVTAAFLAASGVSRRYSATQLRRAFTGLNFRAMSAELSRRHGFERSPQAVEQWVRTEREVVTRHLAQTLQRDPTVHGPLERMAGVARLAVVSSSAGARVDVSLAVTGLSELFPVARRFSAEDLQPPVSKPDPAVYLEALRRLGATGRDAVAVEDSDVGVRAAVAAGVPVLGLLRFVAPAERRSRRAALRKAGACCVVDSWQDVETIVKDRIGRVSIGAR